MDTKKVLGIIFTILIVGAFAFVLTWGIINFNKVKDGMSGTGVYTKEDLDNAYNDGYNTALENKAEYDELINSYRDTITSQTDEISQLNSQINILNNNNKDYKTQVENLQNQKINLENEVQNLTAVKTENEKTILSLNNEIKSLESQITILENSNENKTLEITTLKNQVASLQNVNNQLQRANELNTQTISNLNSQIETLNTQISDMTLQIQNNSSTVSALNNKIAELEKSVTYYEQYIASLENGEQVVVTFEFDGSVYNIQIIIPNSTCSVVNPTSTNLVKFNYWTINDEEIDLSTYKFTTNTKVVANVTYYHNVEFKVDNSVYDTQTILKGTMPTIPSNPTKDGYEFDGWTSNGIDIVNPLEVEINENTTYVAKFTKLHSVKFMVNGSEYQTTTIRNGNKLNNVSYESTTYQIFNGWSLNGVIVDITAQPIYSDTIFVADITQRYDVVFMVDDEVYNSQIVSQNEYLTLPTNPTKDGYEFIGWSIDGINTVDLNNYGVTKNETFVGLFNRKLGFETTSFVSLGSNMPNFGTYELINDNKLYGFVHDNSSSTYWTKTYLYEFDLDTRNTNLVLTYTDSMVDIFSSFIYNGSLYFSTAKHNIVKLNLNTYTYEVYFSDNKNYDFSTFVGLDDNNGIAYLQYKFGSSYGVLEIDLNNKAFESLFSVSSSISQVVILDNYIFYSYGSTTSSNFCVGLYDISTSIKYDVVNKVSKSYGITYYYYYNNEKTQVVLTNGTTLLLVQVPTSTTEFEVIKNNYYEGELYYDNKVYALSEKVIIENITYVYGNKYFGMYDESTNKLTDLGGSITKSTNISFGCYYNHQIYLFDNSGNYIVYWI